MRVTLSDGTFIDAGVVVFAAGVRPRDELARTADLAIADRGGVLTDLSCATADPNVFAIGEVAAIEGRCYGLVGPGYTSAEVVADRLLTIVRRHAPRARLDRILRRRDEAVAKIDDVFMVFISHKQDDHALAVEVKKALEDLAPCPKQIDCFVSGVDITAGMDWRRAIRSRLAKSHLLMLLFTAPDRPVHSLRQARKE